MTHSPVGSYTRWSACKPFVIIIVVIVAVRVGAVVGGCRRERRVSKGGSRVNVQPHWNRKNKKSPFFL